MSYNIGPKIGIDGENEFRSSIRKINDTYKALEAETRAVTAAFDAQGDEQGKLEAASKQLQKQIDKQKEKQALLEDAVKKATDKFGAESIEATRLRGALYDTQATVSKLESELRDTSSRLDSAGDAMEEFAEESAQAGDAAIDFGDILKANVISDVIMDGLRDLVSLVKDFAMDSVEAAASVKAENSQMEQTFAELEVSARQSLQSISDDADIATTRMQGSFTKIYAFAKTAGADSTEALTISSRAMVAAADNAAYYDKSIEEATEQLQSFLKGNYANDAALGIAATETSRNTKANELYAKSFKDLSESQKVDVLLAMVEAGNAASGALGQAARESGSWENVMGELAEAMRQLQAEAGKPALKTLIPVIQRITAEAYELIEDTDWDAFGETVESIANSVIDHGPGIVKAIAAVTAGIVAMKVTQKVGEFVSLAKSIVSIGTAAKTAGEAVAASGAIAAASPWGLAAAAIGAAVALIVSAVSSTKEESSQLEKAMDKLGASIDNANERYDEAANEISGAAYAAEYYIERLSELENAGLDTAEAQREYAIVVEELNKLVPDLNLSIDDQTGLINKNTAALKLDIEAWKRNATAKALQEKFSSVLEAQGQAQAQLIESQAKLNLLKDKETTITERQEQILSEYVTAQKNLDAAVQARDAAVGSSAEEFASLNAAVADAAASYDALQKEMASLDQDLTKNRDSQEALTGEIEAAENTLASYAGELEDATLALDHFNEASGEVSNGQDIQREKIEKVRDAISTLQQAYKDAEAEALDSINSQIGLFDELTLKSDYSASKILENWKNQQRAFTEYRDNLQKAVDMGLDQVLVQQLSDGSAQSMQILDALVNDTEISIDEINAAFSNLSESKDTLATTLGAMAVAADTELANIVAAFKSSGINSVDGLISGIILKQPDYERSLADLAKAGRTSYNQEMAINSPAGKMIPSGEFTVDGTIVGVENRAKAFEEAMSDLALAGERSFLSSQLDRISSYPSVVQAPASYSKSVAHNYGGIVVEVYQQPGESGEDLAYRMMDIIHHEVEAEEAGFGG